MLNNYKQNCRIKKKLSELANANKRNQDVQTQAYGQATAPSTQ